MDDAHASGADLLDELIRSQVLRHRITPKTSPVSVVGSEARSAAANS
jgi:hypothetical protein